MHYALRAVFATLIFVSNAGMWATFTKALNKSSDSVSVSVVSSATNLIVTAILGFLVFGEPLSLLWAFGASLIFLGTILMGSNSSDAKIHAE
ncbi:hypothetical protein GQ42DRAFT_119585 [Ramicandelaber brevisporus]|nr:hypothetical protein GQ42DRAFT_119585 [Ramicandelaber brevisporus]